MVAGGAGPAPNPVLYLERPEESVIVHAHRHLVTDEIRVELVQARQLVTCRVDCSNVLDLRSRAALEDIGLTRSHLESEVGDYAACQQIGAVAHQLGFHGVLADSATRMGESLALFERHLPANELPLVDGDVIDWTELPRDPRRLRLVRNDRK